MLRLIQHLPLFLCMSFSIDTSRIVLRPVTVTFLEMHKPKELSSFLAGTHFELLPKPISANEYRKYYYGVGEKYFWLDRMVMPDEELSDKINAANVDIFLFYVNNARIHWQRFWKIFLAMGNCKSMELPATMDTIEYLHTRSSECAGCL